MRSKKGSALWDWHKKSKEGGLCQKCGIEHKTLTVDHIVPVSILEMLDETGEAKLEWEDNFQFLCSICNAMKANRLDKRNPKTKMILEKLLTNT